MPVLIARGRGCSTFGERGRPRARSRLEFAEADADCLDIAFINNMPDKALEATERQFLGLLEAAAPDRLVRVTLFALPDVPRTDWGRHHLGAHYSPFEELWHRRPDGLIVTGTEPRASDLTAEPYWGRLTEIVDWAEENAVTTIWSCLAAHAAVLHLDGIRRRPLEEKCFGMYECRKASDDVLLDGVEFPLWIPHSRWNDVAEGALVACGYDVLTRTPEVGVDTFVRRQASLFVFFQGHPEYSSETLLREYRRDVGRYLKGERAAFPALPASYLGEEASRLLQAFADRARPERCPELMAEFPAVAAEAISPKGWGASAIRIYRNWLAAMSDRKARQLPSSRSIASGHPTTTS
jgi:homoserine O-succinyltransferase